MIFNATGQSKTKQKYNFLPYLDKRDLETNLLSWQQYPIQNNV